MPADQVWKCRVRPCQQIKQTSNHWFVTTIDADGRLMFEKFDRPERFEKAAKKHGALEICSEKCLHIHMSRWANGRISASDAPACGSPAFRTPTTLTCWVSLVYKEGFDLSGQPGERPALIVVYRDEGRECKMWCFNKEAFPRVSMSVGAHVKFKIQQRKDYAVIVDVIDVLDGPESSKGEKHVNTAATASL
jgi:hypothetical protein